MTAPREESILSAQLWPEPAWRGLASRLVEAPPEQLHRVAGAAALLAVEATFDDPTPLAGALDSLRSGQRGDSAARAQAKEVARLHDEAGFEARDRLDAGHAGAEAEYRREFRRARAALGVWFALSKEPAEAARDGLYEARHALDDDEALRALIARALAE